VKLRGKRSRREIAERITTRTGDTSWTQYRVFDIEGRKGRDRVISPEELLALALTYDVSILELMTPPDEKDGRPVEVRVGRDKVSPQIFFRLAFLLGPEWKMPLGEGAHHGRDKTGAIGPSTSMRFIGDAYNEALAALLPADAYWREWIADEENVSSMIRWVMDKYGIETAWKLDSPRMRRVFIEELGEEE
jgi:hypothetical protein